MKFLCYEKFAHMSVAYYIWNSIYRKCSSDLSPLSHLARGGAAEPPIFCSGWAVFAQVVARFAVRVPCLIYFYLLVLPKYCTSVFTECQKLIGKNSYDFLKNDKSDLKILFSIISVPPIVDYFLFVQFRFNLTWKLI